MATESNMNIIDTKDEGIVVKEIPISISDEKLRNSLSCAYEEAQKDTLVLMGVLFHPEKSNLGNIATVHMGLTFMISHSVLVAGA